MKKKRKLIAISSAIGVLVIILICALVVRSQDDSVEPTINDTVKTITESGEYSNLENYESIVIKTGDVTLNNINTLSITVDEEVGNGTVYLNDVSADEINIIGGGSNSVYLNDVTAEKLNTNYEFVRVVVDKDSVINEFMIYEIKELIIEGVISYINFNDSNNQAAITVNESGDVEEFNIKTDADFLIYGNIDKLNISSVENLEINVENSGYVASLVTSGKIIINGDGTIDKLVAETMDNISGELIPNVYDITEVEVIEEYVVTFDSNSGSSVSSQMVEENSVAKEPSDPTRSGYTFDGWKLDGDLYNFSTSVTKDITLTAEWTKNTDETVVATTYKVTFDSNGGSSVSSQTISENSTASKPSNPTKSGYSFVGWEYNGATYSFSSKVTKNITLEAVWEKNVTTYKVTFDSNGGSSVSSQTIEENSTAKEPSNPTRSGYTFVGWEYNNSAYSFSSKVTKNITLEAVWEEVITYTVKVSLVDNYSPDRILTVYANGTQITVSEIAYSDGYYLCSGSNTSASYEDIKNETEFLITLSSGAVVSAKVE